MADFIMTLPDEGPIEEDVQSDSDENSDASDDDQVAGFSFNYDVRTIKQITELAKDLD